MTPLAARTIVSVPTATELAVARLDAWLETMRGPGGYGGPVVHWWRQCLLYTGPGLDWRYEGLLAGYVTLWQRTGEPRWRTRAERAAQDLLDGQRSDGHFTASAFEANPAHGGTPHEAACCCGLLLLARALRAAGDPGWQRYAAAAERTVRQVLLGGLWDPAHARFRDGIGAASFVPNKAATAAEACLLLAELRGDEALVQAACSALDAVLTHQVTGGPLDGAIAQNTLGARRVEKYFPIYVARCVPALLLADALVPGGRYADAALRAGRWTLRHCGPDGLPPTVVYPDGTSSQHRWLAPLGDVLRAAALLRPYGLDADTSAIERWLLASQDLSGGFATARGFAAQAGGAAGPVPELRDLLRVVGWCDKTFRHLAGQVNAPLPAAESRRTEVACAFRGQRLLLVETPQDIEVFAGLTSRYRWRKGAPRPEVAQPEFWLH